MKSKIAIITLGVRDLAVSLAFYQRLGFRLVTEERVDSIAFFFLEWAASRLALYPREHLAADAEVSAESSGFPGFTLAHCVGSPAEVDALLSEAERCGARIVKPWQAVFWGGYSGYFSDPDGFLWEVAHNPFEDLV